MDLMVAGLLLLVMLVLLASGVWIGLSLIAVGALGMLMFTARAPGDGMAVAIWGIGSSWTLTALPLFLWMGEVLFRTKLSENMFRGPAGACRRPAGACARRPDGRPRRRPRRRRHRRSRTRRHRR
ncbi:MAG: TRAP transporter large permease subunit, partial [Rhodocyclaceae bacterium]|nr:TRAP transporter large permease subunit [Rhodocyclaceae bacterium]